MARAETSSRLLLIAGLLLAACSDDGASVAHGAAPSADDGTDDGADTEEGSDELPEVDGGTLGVTTSSTGAAACAESDLALCFTFDGSPADQSPARLVPAESSGVSFVPGKDGEGAAFAASSALRFAPSPVLDLPPDGATIEAWISRKATGADAVVFDDDNRFSLTINAAGHVWCKSSQGAVVGASIVAAGTWVHVACVLDKGAMRAYVNGVVDAVGTGGIVASPLSGAAVGGNAPSGEAFAGVIDVLRVFRVARPPKP